MLNTTLVYHHVLKSFSILINTVCYQTAEVAWGLFDFHLSSLTVSSVWVKEILARMTPHRLLLRLRCEYEEKVDRL